MPAQISGSGPGRAQSITSSTSLRWGALAEAAIVVRALAGLEAEKPDRQLRDFPALLRECDSWRRDAATNGIDDLAAMAEAGLEALLAINARGGDCRAAANALWQEFFSSRAALLGLLPPGGNLGPRRSA